MEIGDARFGNLSMEVCPRTKRAAGRRTHNGMLLLIAVLIWRGGKERKKNDVFLSLLRPFFYLRSVLNVSAECAECRLSRLAAA